MKKRVIVKAPINIAIVKYWGKRDEALIIPCNGSISATLDTETIYTQTTISFDDTIQQDSLLLNGEETSLSPRVSRLISMMDTIRKKKYRQEGRLPVFIESFNNFPTAAGLASSASGMAALTFGLYKLFELEDQISERQLTKLARQASGSACRSIPISGGFVEWHSPTTGWADKESFAETLPTSEVLDELVILIYIFSSSKKRISSTEGMRRSLETSAFLKHRILHLVPERLALAKELIASGSFPSLLELIIVESNSFHACCLDSYPPIVYLSLLSKSLIDAVTEFNGTSPARVAYSFDAGPNAFIFLRESDLPDWMEFSGKKISSEIPILRSGLGKKGAHIVSFE